MVIKGQKKEFESKSFSFSKELAVVSPEAIEAIGKRPGKWKEITAFRNDDRFTKLKRQVYRPYFKSSQEVVQKLLQINKLHQEDLSLSQEDLAKRPTWVSRHLFKDVVEPCYYVYASSNPDYNPNVTNVVVCARNWYLHSSRSEKGFVVADFHGKNRSVKYGSWNPILEFESLESFFDFHERRKEQDKKDLELLLETEGKILHDGDSMVKEQHREFDVLLVAQENKVELGVNARHWYNNVFLSDTVSEPAIAYFSRRICNENGEEAVIQQVYVHSKDFTFSKIENAKVFLKDSSGTEFQVYWGTFHPALKFPSFKSFVKDRKKGEFSEEKEKGRGAGGFSVTVDENGNEVFSID